MLEGNARVAQADALGREAQGRRLQVISFIEEAQQQLAFAQTIVNAALAHIAHGLGYVEEARGRNSEGQLYRDQAVAHTGVASQYAITSNLLRVE